MDRKQLPRAHVEIVEQPAARSIRFRYICEGRSAGSILGVNSTVDHKTYPSIRIVGYEGRAVIVVSCVTKDEPYRPHPHNLVGKNVCKRGVCTLEVFTEGAPINFPHLGIQCVKRKEIAEALKIREEIRVDPYRTGAKFKNRSMGIDLTVVRLCFQVFLEGPTSGKFCIPLEPIVTNPIYDKKSASELVICKLSHCSAPVNGGMEMIMLCEKIVKDDVQVLFFQIHNGQVVWRDLGKFHSADIHKQTAISFKTPAYHTNQISEPIPVFIQLRRPSDSETSDPLPFVFTPLADDPVYAKRKRQKLSNSGMISERQYSDNVRNWMPEVAKQSTSVEVGSSIIPRENYRMALLEQLQVDAERNDEIRNQLGVTHNVVNSLTSHSVVNNNYGNEYMHPNAMTRAKPSAPTFRLYELIRPRHSVPNEIESSVEPQISNCTYNGAPQIPNRSNPQIPSNCSPMPQSMYNEAPVLYDFNRQKPMSDCMYQQPHNPMNNYVVDNSTNMNNNQVNFNMEQTNTNLGPLCSADLEVLESLSESFYSGLLITDTDETQSKKDDGVAVDTGISQNNNIWLG